MAEKAAVSIIRTSIGSSIKHNPFHLWKHGLPTPGVMSIIWSLWLKKTENWHGENQRRAIKLDKELLYENRLRNNILQSGKTKTLKEHIKKSKNIMHLARKNTEFSLNVLKT